MPLTCMCQVSPAHRDPYHNALLQCQGSKKVLVFNPDDTEFLYPHTQGGTLKNTSQIDVENIDSLQFPNAHKARFVEIHLQEQELLYIPKNYFHFVRSLTPSLSINFWFV